MKFELKDNTLILYGNLTYLELPEIIAFLKRIKPVKVDVTRATKIDTSFLLYLLRLDVELILKDEQKKLSKIVEDNITNEVFEIRKEPFLSRVGRVVIDRLYEFYLFLAFLGEVSVEFIKVLANPKRFRLREIASDIELMGLNAVPILTTISFLIGAVIAYHGSVRLKQFGANIFVVDLVSISILRELGPLLVAILLAGRSASAYTAQIGIMKVTEEVDVIKTMGINPFDVIVFPKIISMFVIFPLLIILADIVGIFGGVVVAKFALGITVQDFILRLHSAVNVRTFLSGILKAPAFALLIANIGAFKGYRTQKNVESIGKSVTISVVDSIFAVIIADAVFSVLFRWMGI